MEKKHVVVIGDREDPRVIEKVKEAASSGVEMIVIDEEEAIERRRGGSALAKIMALASMYSFPADYVPTLAELNTTGKKDKRPATKVGVRTEPKIGRNTPCTCGSGKKYKKCCLISGE